ncbi:MAG: uncharacterized membrane protein YgdD (TMEM256/DUF423 family) [Arcobacteraceae bacterium]|jgi:uncharacterized membrane protein YgdD (TMEM256/DUF423 family)
MINQNTKSFMIIASFMMAITIAIGAFGAHGLKPYLDEYSSGIYQKAVSYQFYNTLGLFFISFVSYLLPTSTKIIKSFYFVLSGTLIFSFSLYILALSKILWLGAITPIGGAFMIIGWILCGYCIIKEIEIDA